MTQSRRTVRVTRDQILSARALAQPRGGVEHLSPTLRAVAAVPLATPGPEHASRGAVESAQELIALRGGPEHVSETIRHLAATRPSPVAPPSIDDTP